MPLLLHVVRVTLAKFSWVWREVLAGVINTNIKLNEMFSFITEYLDFLSLTKKWVEGVHKLGSESPGEGRPP